MHIEVDEKDEDLFVAIIRMGVQMAEAGKEKWTQQEKEFIEWLEDVIS